jgi:hypothetical protein
MVLPSGEMARAPPREVHLVAHERRIPGRGPGPEPAPCGEGGGGEEKSGEQQRPRTTAGCRGARRAQDARADRAGTVEGVAELLRGAEAVGGQLLQRGEHRVLDGGRDGAAAGDERDRLLGEHLGHDGLRRGARERGLADEHLVGHGAEGVDVAAGADVAVAHGLFGTHVARRAEGHAGLRHAIAGLARGEGDAEVGDEGAAVVQQDVLGLDVAVDDAALVGVVEGGCDFLGEADGVGDGELLLAGEAVAEGLAFDVGHDVVEELGADATRSFAALRMTKVRGARVEEGQDVGMLQVRGGLDLAEEALGADDGGEFGAEDLDGDLAVVLEVVGEVDGGHAALAELALEAVAVGQGGGEADGDVVHVVVLIGRAVPRRRCRSGGPRW